MKAKTLSIKRSTLVSAFLVGAVIAVCSASEVRADTMADATVEQKAASTEIAVSLEKISNIAEENALSIREVTGTANQMAETASELRNMVGQFKVG